MKNQSFNRVLWLSPLEQWRFCYAKPVPIPQERKLSQSESNGHKMRLKSLELQGFKSFPDRTRIAFDTGMTVVIGPNGSGKSNIADAIRWVLGELSSKNIRGNKMEDVIFGGTDTRRPMGYAEVSLTFDNTSGEIPLPVEYGEVTVTRKYYRSGDSEYMINGKSVRLRDITEMFMNTGLGKSGYSIIGQGRIAEIISKKSEDRRGIFEEAAGISKFRQRKSESERKLEKTEDNLSRITDILSELEGRVGPLEKYAEKAKKYIELFSEKKSVDVALWLYEIDSILTRSEKLRRDYEIAKHELEMAEDTLSGLDRQLDILYTRSHENMEKSETSRKEISALTEQRHAAGAEALLLERDIEHAIAEEKRLTIEQQKKSTDGQASADSILRLQKEIESKKAEIDKSAAALEKAQKALENLREDISLAAEHRTDLLGQTEAGKNALQALKLELSGLEGTKLGEATRKEDLEEQIGEVTGRIAATGKNILSAEKTLSDYTARKDAIAKTIAGCEKDITSLEADISEKERLARDTEVRVNTIAENVRLLRRMEEHFEGYAGSVKQVMSKAAEGRLKGICGPVSKLISVGERYATAIEIALGGALQNIVVENEDAAKSAIEELKRSGSGRATFYPLSTVQPQPLGIDYRKLESMPGFVGVASGLVTSDKKYLSVIEYLLGRTVICESIEDCAAISKKFGYRFKSVSLDGQVVNQGGSFTGGSVRKEGGMLSRGAQILRLGEEEQKLNGKKQSLLSEISALKNKVSELKASRESEAATLRLLDTLYSAEETRYTLLKSKLAEDNALLSTAKDSLTALRDQMAGYDSRRAKLESDIAEKERELLRLQKEAKHAEEGIHRLEEARTASIDRKNALLLEKNILEKDLLSLERDLERTTADALNFKSEADRCAEELVHLSVRKTAAEQKKKEKEALSSNLLEQIKKIEETDSELKKEIEDFEKQSESIRVRQREQSKHREKLLQEYTRLEAANEAIKTEQDRYTARLWEEYELTYAASKELDYPEVTEATRGEAVLRSNRLKHKIKDLGSVNVGAIDEYTEVKERYDTLRTQYDDLVTAKAELLTVISGLENDMKNRFSEVFSAINENFRAVFAELFGGGTAELSLSDPQNTLESGIEINVAPPGKIIKSLSLLSGGEQVFVAIALFFAILRVTPAPFCLLDEIEAALDEVNVARFAGYVKNYSDKTQFIIISHRRGTMEEADTMYGVTMSERGISKVLPLHLQEAEAKTGLKAT